MTINFRWLVGVEPIEWNVSVCEHAEGSRACGGFILSSSKVNIIPLRPFWLASY